jgi:K(+)-stimulated pyrophosphate-energized sodium pump
MAWLVAGLLIGSIISGFMVAVMMANAGGAWDNAKKWVESGELGGKGTEVRTTLYPHYSYIVR